MTMTTMYAPSVNFATAKMTMTMKVMVAPKAFTNCFVRQWGS